MGPSLCTLCPAVSVSICVHLREPVRHSLGDGGSAANILGVVLFPRSLHLFTPSPARRGPLLLVVTQYAGFVMPRQPHLRHFLTAEGRRPCCRKSMCPVRRHFRTCLLASIRRRLGRAGKTGRSAHKQTNSFHGPPPDGPRNPKLGARFSLRRHTRCQGFTSASALSNGETACDQPCTQSGMRLVQNAIEAVTIVGGLPDALFSCNIRRLDPNITQPLAHQYVTSKG